MSNLVWPVVAGVVLGAALGGCASKPKDVIVAPTKLLSPYDAARGDVLWAVAPVRNESGTTVFDTATIGDKLVAAAEEIEGVRCVPLNRTLDAMRSLNMQVVRTPGDARTLAAAMGVDGILIGTVTAWEPYTPKIGISVALYASPSWMQSGRTRLDPRTLSSSPTVATPDGVRYADAPAAVASEHLDGKNNQVLMDLQNFAQGRQKHDSALGWRRYLVSMDLYSEFAAFRMMDGLLREEWLRANLARASAAAGEGAGSRE